MPVSVHLNEPFMDYACTGSFMGSDISSVRSDGFYMDFDIPYATDSYYNRANLLVFVVGKLPQHESRSSIEDQAALVFFDNLNGINKCRFISTEFDGVIEKHFNETDAPIYTPSYMPIHPFCIAPLDNGKRTRIIFTFMGMSNDEVSNVRNENTEFRYLIAPRNGCETIPSTMNRRSVSLSTSTPAFVINRLYNNCNGSPLIKTGIEPFSLGKAQSSSGRINGTIGLSTNSDYKIYPRDYDIAKSILLINIKNCFSLRRSSTSSTYDRTDGFVVSWPSFIEPTISEDNHISAFTVLQKNAYPPDARYPESTDIRFSRTGTNSDFVTIEFNKTWRGSSSLFGTSNVATAYIYTEPEDLTNE